MFPHFKIELNGLRFFAAHGVHEEEQLVGNEFEVNITLELEAPAEKITSIEQTVNYAEVYRITKELFSNPTPLLETLAMEIADELKKNFSAIKKLSLQIIKLHAPITSFTGKVSVSYVRDYE